jgi:hypothetical protein
MCSKQPLFCPVMSDPVRGHQPITGLTVPRGLSTGTAQILQEKWYGYAQKSKYKAMAHRVAQVPGDARPALPFGDRLEVDCYGRCQTSILIVVWSRSTQKNDPDCSCAQTLAFRGSGRARAHCTTPGGVRRLGWFYCAAIYVSLSERSIDIPKTRKA